ncbi:MAG: CHAT domain-containing protein [Gemmatimonadetes bacterium]|nr:CHAT domain-containing protein [Gemmatimonadota bacterium]
MTVVSFLLAGTLLGAMPQEAPQAGALIDLATTGSLETLVAQVRLHPDAVREALHDLMRESGNSIKESSPTGNQGERRDVLGTAERLARAYFEAWTDPFLIQEVDRFRSWSLDERQTKLIADSLRNLGNEAYLSEGISPAMEFWRGSLLHSERLGDLSGVAKSLGNLGAGFFEAGEPDSARVYLTEAYQRATEMGDFRTASSAVTNLANLAFENGDLPGAADLFGQAVVILSRTGEHRFLSAVQHNLALVALDMGDMGAAREALEQSIQLSRLHGYPEDEAEGLATLANLAQAEGKYREAAEHLDRALDLSRQTGSRVAEAGVHHSLGLLWMARGDYRTAEDFLEQSRATYLELGRLPDAVDVRMDLAQARAASGDLRGGLNELREAEILAGSLALGPIFVADLALTAADLNLALNEYPAALALFLEARGLYAAANHVVGEAEALEGQGYLSLLREDFEESRELLGEALRLRTFTDPVDPRASALNRLYLAVAEEGMGHLDDARQTLIRAGMELALLGDPVGEAAVLATLGDLEERAGAPWVADSLFVRGLLTLGDRTAPDVEWRLRGGRARLLAASGSLQKAAQEYRLAIAGIERSAETLPLESRSGFRTNKAEVYEQFAQVLLSLGDVGAAFQASESTRARQTLAAMMGARITPVAGVSGDLLERQQDLAERIGYLAGRLRWGNLPRPGLRETPGSLPLEPSELRGALARSQAEYTELLSEMRREAPGYSALVDPVPASLTDISSLLDSDQVLIEYLVAGENTLVFIATADTVAALKLEIGREPLGDMVDFARGVIANRGRGDEGNLWRAPLRRLNEILFRPVEETGLLQGRRSLVIVPHGRLHYLPFQALLRPDDGSFLAERYAVSYAPSASAWVRLKKAKADQERDMSRREELGPSRVFRVLAMAPRVEELPGSRYEVEVIGRLFGDRAHTLVGEEASEEALRSAESDFDIVHLATYGVLNKANPLFSYVELAGTGDDPGFLEAHEIFGLGLQARLLTLSACETGIGSGGPWDVPPGDDWVSLSTAFLGSGVSNVLASLWQVEDLATAELMQGFYRHLVAGDGLTGALANAQRKLIANSDTAHPFFWAGFQLVGEGGGPL